MSGVFPKAVRAITEAVLLDRIGPEAVALAGPVSGFVLGQYSRMPDYLRLPVLTLTLLCDSWPLWLGFWRPLHRLPLEQRRLVIASWKRSRVGFRRSLIKFYESLAVYGWAAGCPEHLNG